MQLSDIFLGLGRESLDQLLRAVSLGKLKTFQLFDRVKTRLHLTKLNQDNLRKCAPKLWTRFEAKDEQLAIDLSHVRLAVQGASEELMALLDARIGPALAG